MKSAACIAVMLITSAATAEESTLRDASHEARRPHARTLGDQADHDSTWMSTVELSSDQSFQASSEISTTGSTDGDLVPVRAEQAVLITSPTPSGAPIQRVAHETLKPAVFPYANHAQGWMTPGEHTGIGRMSLEVASIESDLLRTTLASRFYLPGPCDVDVRGSWYREQLESETVDLVIGVVDVNWRAFESSAYAWRIGAGFRVSHDEQGSLGGWNLSSGIEVYPLRPLAVSFAGEVGSLGSATVTGLRAAAVGHLHRWALEVGWQRTSIGEVDLDGPFVAVQCSF